MSQRVRVYAASSLDGFIAGRDDDLSWLPDPSPHDPAGDGVLTYEALMEEVGALLMGRRTYDVVMGFEVEWPYADLPVLVASHRDLGPQAPNSVRRIEGPIGTLIAAAKEAAAGRDVYIDGGALIRQACDADLVDELTLTFAPIGLGSGKSLFAGLTQPYGMRIVHCARFPGGMLQIRLVPERG